MRKLLNFIIVIALIGLIIFGVYKFFFDCEKTEVDFERLFVLNEPMDYAVVGEEAIVKLLKVEDNRCLEENCEREGQQEVKLIVMNDMKITYVTLGTLSESKKEIEKLNYLIELDNVEGEKVTLKLTKLR